MNHVLLVVEPKPSIRILLNDSFLNESNILVRAADSGQQALSQIKVNPPNVVVMDTMTADIASKSLCKEIRTLQVGVRIIVISDDPSNVSATEHIENGADDYIFRPFDIEELKARIHARLRYSVESEENIVKCDDLLLNPETIEVFVKDKKFDITAKEFDLLKLLMINKNRILTREKILNTVWGYLYDVETRAVDMQISKLRKKLKEIGSKTQIESVRSFGYRMIEVE